MTTADDGAPTSRTSPESIVPRNDPPPAASVPTPAGGPVAAAVADLAARLGVAVDEIGVVSAEEVTWRDGAAGCPQPGMQYIQVLTNGSRIRLVAAGVVYQYHTRGMGAPFLCTSPEEPLSSAGGLGDS